MIWYSERPKLTLRWQEKTYLPRLSLHCVDALSIGHVACNRKQMRARNYRLIGKMAGTQHLQLRRFNASTRRLSCLRDGNLRPYRRSNNRQRGQRQALRHIALSPETLRGESLDMRPMKWPRRCRSCNLDRIGDPEPRRSGAFNCAQLSPNLPGSKIRQYIAGHAKHAASLSSAIPEFCFRCQCCRRLQ